MIARAALRTLGSAESAVPLRQSTHPAYGLTNMNELSKEQQILIAMRKTLSAIIKDVTPPPGMRHPLSDSTIADVRQCLGLIAAREKELADAQGRGGERPYYADEPPAARVVPIASLKKREE